MHPPQLPSEKALCYTLAYSLITILFLAGIWDIYAAMGQNGRPSVSSIITMWITRWPFLAFVIGGLIIHLIGLTPR